MKIIRARYRDGSDFLRHYQPAFDGGGIFFPTREALPDGTEVLVEMSVPPLQQKIVLRGRVAWRRAGRHSTKLRAGLGIEFHPDEAMHRDFVLAAARGEVGEIAQRRHRRLPVQLAAEWRLPNARLSHFGRIEDIGPGGAFVRTPEPVAVGRDIFIDVVPPGSISPREITGRVSWIRSTPGDEGFGIEFRSRDAGGTRLLKELVRRLEAAEGGPDGAEVSDDAADADGDPAQPRSGGNAKA